MKLSDTIRLYSRSNSYIKIKGKNAITLEILAITPTPRSITTTISTKDTSILFRTSNITSRRQRKSLRRREIPRKNLKILRQRPRNKQYLRRILIRND